MTIAFSFDANAYVNDTTIRENARRERKKCDRRIVYRRIDVFWIVPRFTKLLDCYYVK